MTWPDLGSSFGQTWGLSVRDADSDEVVVERNAASLLDTASVAKVFALIEVAARIEDGETDPATLLDRREVLPVADSGVWQHLRVDRLPVEDVARLVGAVSDNLATNVLLRHLGLDRVRARAGELAPGGSNLHDVVRDERGPGDPDSLSTGCARDWSSIFSRLHRGEIVSPEVSARVLDWTALNTDLSMVAAAFDLDPLGHTVADLGLRLRNKTGTDAGVRADVGLVSREGRHLAYAAICTWDDSGGEAARRQVLASMRALGGSISSLLSQAP